MLASAYLESLQRKPCHVRDVDAGTGIPKPCSARTLDRQPHTCSVTANRGCRDWVTMNGLVRDHFRMGVHKRIPNGRRSATLADIVVATGLSQSGEARAARKITAGSGQQECRQFPTMGLAPPGGVSAPANVLHHTA